VRGGARRRRGSNEGSDARIEELRHRLFCRRGCRESTIEDIALSTREGLDSIGTDDKSCDGIGKADAFDRGSDASHPSRTARGSAGGTDRVIDRLAVGEGKMQGEGPRPLAALLERVTDGSDEPMDREEQAFDVAQLVVGPRDFRGWRLRRREWGGTRRYLPPGESPETHAFDSAADRDRIMIQCRQIGAGFDSYAVEESEDPRVDSGCAREISE